MNRFLLSIFIVASSFTCIHCSSNGVQKNEKELLSFTIPNRAISVMPDAGGNLTVKIYGYADITRLVPIVIVSPSARVSPSSGTTVDFTTPVTYIITAQDGSSKTFTVTVERSLSSEKELLSFAIPNTMSNVAVDNDGNLTVILYEPVAVTALVPIVRVSPNASVFPASGAVIDFTDPVFYTITAQDGSSTIFTVTITLSLSSEKELLSFAIPNNASSVTINNDGSVTVRVYEFIDVTKLVPVITISPGASVIPTQTEVDFTNPVLYTITAQDGSETTFTVTVVKELSRYNEIINFTLDGTEQIFEREGNDLFIYVPYETDITNIKTNIVISDKATISPASGTFSNFTNPQIYTVTASDGAVKKILVTVKKSPWKLMNPLPEFTPRDGAGLVEFKGKFWLLGGWKHGPVCSEVWNSNDGINWVYVNDAPWEGRHGAGFVVFNDAMWVIGGDGIADVWTSVDGIIWTLVTDDPPWGRRYAPYVAVFKNKLWLMGGINWWDNGGNFRHDNGVQAHNDVWSSEDGETWVLENLNATWTPRGLIHGYVVLNNELYIIGGGIKGYANDPNYSNTITEYNDVWKTNDGIIWHRVLQNAPWKARTHFSITTYCGNIIVSDGSIGDQAGLSNETWYSSDGRNWKQLKYSFWTKTHASSIGVFNNRLWLVAGFALRNIWSLDFSDLQSVD